MRKLIVDAERFNNKAAEEELTRRMQELEHKQKRIELKRSVPLIRNSL
jgi:hypothetical protein